VTLYLRSLSVLNTLYIDDRLGVSENSRIDGSLDHSILGAKVAYVMLELLTRLGYTLSLSKCSLELSTCNMFLGFSVDSVRQPYILPGTKSASLVN